MIFIIIPLVVVDSKNLNVMNRIKVLKESKFNRLSQHELIAIKGGGLCISCKKRDRKVEVELSYKKK